MAVGGYIYLKLIHFYNYNLEKSHLRNARRYGDGALFSIGWYTSIAAGLDTVHPNWMALYFHCITEKNISYGGGGTYV